MPGVSYNYDAGSGDGSNSGGSSNVSLGGGVTSQNGDEDCRRPPFTMHGVLHFLKYEWSRYEMERNEWEMERAELRARISFLVGERKAQESLKRDLVRRIKMLEHTLNQERRAQSAQPMVDENTDEVASNFVSNVPMDVDAIEKGTLNSQTWNDARQVLRQFLQEIGYSEKILDVRSFRVKNLLGQTLDGGGGGNGLNGNGGESGRKAAEKAIYESEQAILDTANVIKMSRGKTAGATADDSKRYGAGEQFATAGDDSDSDDNEEKNFESEVLDALDEFSFLQNDKKVGGGSCESKTSVGAKDQHSFYHQLVDDSKRRIGAHFKRVRSSDLHATAKAYGGPVADIEGGPGRGLRCGLPTNLSVDSALGLPSGDAYDIVDIKDDFAMAEEDALASQQQRWNIRFTLRSHYDAIRAMQFHPVEPVLITASEDGTAKLWDLSSAFAPRTADHGKAHSQPTTGIVDVEPVYTFRGHKGPILCMDMSSTGEMCYTGGYDGSICCFVVPLAKMDVYSTYDPSVLQTRLTGHMDSIWALNYHSSTNRLISASADGTIRLWEAEVAKGMQNLVKTFVAPAAVDGTTQLRPRSIDVVSTDPQQLLTAYSGALCSILDLETGRNVLTFDFENGNSDSIGEINKILSHPTMPVTIIAGEDRKIRVFDNNSGKLIDTVVAHVEGVSSLAIDPNGLYLLSGSHDCSLRLWNMEKRICLQEIAAHRKKHNMSVMAVAFHPSRPLIASAGADSLAKVFTPSRVGDVSTKPAQFPVAASMALPPSKVPGKTKASPGANKSD